MAQTTTAQNACDVVISLDDDGGSLVDVSGNANQLDWTFTVGVGEWWNFGFPWPKRLTCSLDGSASLIVTYSTAADEGYRIIADWFENSQGAARTFRWDTPDTSAGSHRIQGEWVLQDFAASLVAGEGGPITVTATLLTDGPQVFSTIAS